MHNEPIDPKAVNTAWAEFLGSAKACKKFHPVSYVVTGMDMVHTCFHDTSETALWHGPIHLETCYANNLPNEPLVGFNLVSLRALLDTRKTRLVPVLLARALVSDLTNPARLTKVGARECLALYARVFGALLSHPRAWRICS